MHYNCPGFIYSVYNIGMEIGDMATFWDETSNVPKIQVLAANVHMVFDHILYIVENN